MLPLLEAGFPGPARGVFTTRQGGTSDPPWDSLNLAVQVGDTHSRVERNRALLVEQLGLTGLAFGKQVHGTGVHLVPGPSKRAARGFDDTDGLVTTSRGLGLVIKGADCLPVLLSSVTGTPVVGGAHVGRAGLAKGIVAAVVERMRREGAGELAAVVGPGICGGCYEVPASMAAEVERAAPGSRCTTTAGTSGIDLLAGATAQLAALGVEASSVGGCTAEQPELFFSYRRDQLTGRQAGIVWLT